MSFFQKYGGLKKLSDAKKEAVSTKAMLLEAIEDQRTKLISLSNPYTKIPSKSRVRWFKDNGMFIPYVSMYRFFGEEYISYEKGNEISVLDDLEKAVRNGDTEIEKYIIDVDIKRKKSRIQRTDKYKIKKTRKKSYDSPL